MDSGACKNLGVKGKDSCLRSSQKLDEDIVVLGANKDVSELPDAAECNGSLVPITPNADRENGDFRIDLQSPLTVMKKPFKLSDIDSNCKENGRKVAALVDNSSPKTPEDGVFDPFAPGPEIMARAPLCKKYANDLRSCVARRLNFNPSSDAVQPKSSCFDGESPSDQEMFESVYENLLEVILSTQAEAMLAEISDVVYDSEYCKTPPSAIQLSGIADTCPGAPVKPGNKPRIIPVGLRRKLEF
ncbi:unknown protein 1-like [Neltuma alba]|uniref:unknown protein 1-like n=1 Tax=Neltuma alba TaxID=207710 RepID=UPI0010A2F862|nr:unknown protein 1-like [Prosopis alba]XP_028776343.1 unknown protein 1-like [Prosopis alba]XP_028808563.1 unknown protein 1-like [Prosopis alba]XP_028808564.1 unknown protein 1-like [Prosopis alba]